jgi:excisionase family DNA binding protein
MNMCGYWIMKLNDTKESLLVGPEVVASRLNVSRNTVLNWARNGEIPSVKIKKIYRFCLKDVSKRINFDLKAA